jgi:hypothetical protein
MFPLLCVETIGTASQTVKQLYVKYISRLRTGIGNSENNPYYNADSAISLPVSSAVKQHLKNGHLWDYSGSARSL